MSFEVRCSIDYVPRYGVKGSRRAGRVSYMTPATTTPETKVSAAMAAMAKGTATAIDGFVSLAPPQLLSGNRSAPAPGGLDDRSHSRAADRRGAWRDRPRQSEPWAPGTSRAVPGSRPAPRTPPRPRTRRPHTAGRALGRTPGRQDRSRLAAPDAAEGSVDRARPASRSPDPR